MADQQTPSNNRPRGETAPPPSPPSREMADQQTPSNKRPRGETTPPPSPPLKARRLDDPPVSPPDSAEGFEDSSLAGPSNSSITTAISKSADAAAVRPIPKPRVPTKLLSEMTREELMEFHDPIRCAERERIGREVQKRIDDRKRNMSRAELEQWRVDYRKKHGKIDDSASRSPKLILHVGIPGPKPVPYMSFEDVIDSIHYESDEE